jgi:hypothetical protein
MDFDNAYGGITRQFYTHLWDIIAALGSNQSPLPQLQSLTIRPWLGDSSWNSLYDAAPIAQLVTSLRHLSFSVWHHELFDSRKPAREPFWKPVVVRGVLQRATRLESLAISGNREFEGDRCLDVSELATYPGLAALSLTNILWEDGEIEHQSGVVQPPAVEDFIARHRKTLKTLKLHNCAIGIPPGRSTPFCYWADVYDRLAKALTELVELEVEFHVDGFRTQYACLSPESSAQAVKTLDGTEQDGLSLEKFKAVVKTWGTGADSEPQL